MELLPQGQQNTIKVTYEDQQRINQFSKLIMRKDVVEQELSQHRQEKEYLDDVSLEIELIDEDEPVHYKVGVIFMLLNQHEVVQQLEEDVEKVQESISSLETQEDQLENEIKELKTVLYAKFGDNINLER